MLIKWDNERLCNKPWEASSPLPGLTYIIWRSTVNKMKLSEGFKLLRIFPSRRWIYTYILCCDQFGQGPETEASMLLENGRNHLSKPKEMKAEEVQMNVGIWKRKYCTHYSHQSCTGNMNSSNCMNISHLYQQIPPVIFTDVDGHPVMNNQVFNLGTC